MSAFTNISRELKSSLSGNTIFKILLPLDIIFVFGGLIIMVLESISKFSLGGLIDPLIYWVFILGLFLAFANTHLQYLFVGLLGYGLFQLIYWVLNIHSWSWGYLYRALIFAGIGYLVLQKSLGAGGGSQQS